MDRPLIGEPLAVDLMNTFWLQRDGEHDVLGTVAGLGQWLAEREVPGAPTERMRSALVHTREILRAVIEGEPDAERRLNAVLARGVISRALRDGLVEQAVTVADSAWALAWEAADDYLRLRENAADGIRRCEQPACVLYFYDPSGRRRWCSMAGCGNRAKAQRHYAKRRR